MRNTFFAAIAVGVFSLVFLSCSKPPAPKGGRWPTASEMSAGKTASALPGAQDVSGAASLISSSKNDAFCSVWAVGNDSAGNVLFGERSPACITGENEMVFSVTHERANNSHVGDKNYRENIRCYMADYFPADIGKWLNRETLLEKDKSKSFSLLIDTINYRAETPTGRPVEDGWLFFGLNDGPDSAILGERDLILRFRYKISGSEVIPKSEPNGLIAGHRLILGFTFEWKEPAPRTNTAHYLEVNLHKTADYHKGQDRYCPNDGQEYDQCFYDLNGKYAEGQYFDVSRVTSARTETQGDWKLVEMNVSGFMKSRKWFHPPASWKDVRITPYFGVESKGKSRIWAQVENFSASYIPTNGASTSGQNPSWGYFRDGIAGYVSSGADYCFIDSPEQMKQCGFSQINYDSAPQYSRAQITLPFKGQCSCGLSPAVSVPTATPTVAPTSAPSPSQNPPIGFFRDGVAGYVNNGSQYCFLSSGEQMKQCGFSQANYDNAVQYTVSQISLPFAGECNCSGAKFLGFFRSGFSGFISSLEGHCSLDSSEHMKKCGYSQSQYDAAPQMTPAALGNYLGSCVCR